MTSTHLSLREPDAVLGLLNRRRGVGRHERLLRGGLCLLPAVVVAFAGFQRRWMSDDGHIYVRTVRQILAGNGPVFNAGERAESSTGTLWQWLLVLAGWPGFDIAAAAMFGGLLLTAAGFAFASLGAMRLYAGSAALPLGCLVLLALPPVWDFATSGLETGLATCWIAGSWLLLVTRARSFATCVVLGLGPLVRPDLALVSAVFLGAQWLMVRPERRPALVGLSAALALPVAYEIFRAGYYGQLMPLPGVTKEASRSLWARGFDYLGDFAGPYLLWVPALFLVAALLPSASSRRYAAPLVPALAPVVAGLLCWVYVIKVGGDFMHGRMFLPGLFLMLLPVFLVPLTRAWAIAAVGIGVWAVVCAAFLRTPYAGWIGPAGVADERGVYVRQNAAPHPLHHDFAGQPGTVAYARLVRDAERESTPALILGRTVVGANSPTVTGVYNTLGFSGTVVPLDGAALDPIGLAYPLAAHSERFDGRVGHDKRLPDAWIFADRGHGALPKGLSPVQVAAARRALDCGQLAELRAATRDPMTPGRFLRNVTGAWDRTSFRFPNSPEQAERQLCGA
jgi:arabinofuranosyltransferase